jgi:hypothetical protein
VPTATPSDAEWFLGMVDWDQSGTVSFPEYLKGVSEFGKKGRKSASNDSRTFTWQEAAYLYDAFTQNDKDGKKMLTFSQLHLALRVLKKDVSRTAVSDLVRRVDAAQSQYVTFGEFVKGVAFSDIHFAVPGGRGEDAPLKNPKGRGGGLVDKSNGHPLCRPGRARRGPRH